MIAKRSRPKLLRFPKPKVADDTQFIETLVWVLAQARAGKILGYAMTFMVETEGKDGIIRTIESAKQFEDRDKHHVLGAIERMKMNFLAREFSE